MRSEQVENVPSVVANATTSPAGAVHDNGEGQSPSSSHLDQLLCLDEITRQINSSIELETVLREVAAAAKRLLAADDGWVYLLDPSSGILVLKASVGVSDERSIAAVEPLELGRGLAGLAAKEDRPVITDDALNDPRADAARRALIESEQLKAILSVPIHATSKLVGVLGVCTRDERKFADDDVSLLTRLANQTGIAIQNARLYEGERAKVAELREQRERHDQLTRLAAASCGLDVLAATLAKLVGNPVVVVNRFGQVIACASRASVGRSAGLSDASGPEGCPAEDELQRVAGLLAKQPATGRLLQAIADSGCPMREDAVAAGGIPPRVVAPIMVENKVWAYVWVFEFLRPLGELDRVAIEHAATIMALEMLREKTAFEVETRLKGDLIESLLSSDYADEAAIMNRAGYLGYDLDETHRLAIAGIDDFAGLLSRGAFEERHAIAIQERLFDVVSAVVRDGAPRSLAVKKSDAVILMVNVVECRLGIDWLLDQVRARVAEQMPEITVSIGVGCECHGLADFRRSHDEARRSLLILKNAGRRNETARFEQLDVYDLLFSNSEPKIRQFVERVLGPIIAHDRRYNAQLIATLLAYLECGLNQRLCARALHVHYNTLSYRLQRLREIGGLDLESREARLRVDLALHLMQALSC